MNILTQKINTNQNKITILRRQLKDLKEDYAAMIVKAYKTKSNQSKLMFVLSSNNFKQAYKRLQYIKQYANHQKAQAVIIEEKTKELQNLNTKLSKQKNKKLTLLKANKRAKKKLETEEKARQSIMATIRAEMTTYSLQIKKKKQQSKKLDQQIERLIAEAIRLSHKKNTNKTATSKFLLTPEAKKLASNFYANKGKLGWPVKTGFIRSKFGKTASLIDKSIVVNNSGIKIATQRNAHVKAVFKGKVSKIFIVKNGNSGVMIQHGNYFTIYYNLSSIAVKLGDNIKTGQPIGKVFTNPTTRESLLDFRIYKNTQKLNPQYWLSKN